MFLFKKKRNNFEKLRDEVNKLLNKRKFDSALARFSDFSDSYNKLKLTKKIEFEEDYSLIKDQLILYMKIKEIDILISDNDLERVRDTLLYIETKMIRLRKGAPALLEYISNQYNNCLNIYHAMVYKENFDENLHNLYNLIEREEYGESLKLFPSLFKSLGDVSDHSNLNPALYDQLQNLKKEVEVRLLEKKAYGKVAEVDVKKLRASLRKSI
ncbi:MAG: hypothetical protein ABIH25_01150 [Candidatus Woesearchaeota archaeon]